MKVCKSKSSVLSPAWGWYRERARCVQFIINERIWNRQGNFNWQFSIWLKTSAARCRTSRHLKI